MVLYAVASADEQGVTFAEAQGTYSCEQVRQFFDFSWAMTYASVQGQEFDDRLRLWDCSHPCFTRRHLFVALSRGKRAQDVDLRE